MSLAAQRTTIEAGFITAMDISKPGLIIIGENADVDPPESAAWVRMSITVLDIIYPCINNEHEQTDAIFNVQIFTPIGQGASEASIIADAAKLTLRADNYGNAISFLSFDLSTGAIEAGWFSLILRATYRAQD